jgi:hypothetical protein
VSIDTRLKAERRVQIQCEAKRRENRKSQKGLDVVSMRY